MMFLIFILLIHSSVVLGSLESYLNAPVDLFKNVDIPKPPKTPFGFGDIIKSDSVVGVTQQLLKLTSNKNILQTLFNNFKKIFNKAYDDDENSMRQQLFKDKLIKVVNHNIKARSGQVSFETGINPFSDMTTEEVVGNYTGLMGLEDDTFANFTSFELFDPDSPPPMPPLSLSLKGRTKRQTQTSDAIDWRTYGVVSSVKYQGRCGSCTLFAATACLESSWYLWKRGPLHDLSEQELIDCIPKDDGHRGCGGNDFPSTIRYQVLQGQSIEMDYPYTEKDGECKNRTSASKAMKFYQIRKDEKSLQKAVDDYGPVAVGMHVGDPFVDYESGILDVDCRGDVNHALLVVGFGTENGKDYWLLKNSWGDWWGEDGYMKLRRNKNNMCKIASSGYFMTA